MDWLNFEKRALGILFMAKGVYRVNARLKVFLTYKLNTRSRAEARSDQTVSQV